MRRLVASVHFGYLSLRRATDRHPARMLANSVEAHGIIGPVYFVGTYDLSVSSEISSRSITTFPPLLSHRSQ